MKFNVYLYYTTHMEIEIEAKSEDEAVEIARENQKLDPAELMTNMEIWEHADTAEPVLF